MLDGANVQAGNGISITNSSGRCYEYGRITFSVVAANNSSVADDGISVNGSNLSNVAADTVVTTAERIIMQTLDLLHLQIIITAANKALKLIVDLHMFLIQIL